MDWDYIKVTELTEYLYCPRKIFLKRILGFEEETKEEMLKGKIIHDIYDLINSNEEYIVYNILDPLSLNQVYKIYEQFVLENIDKILEKYEEEISKLNLNKNSLKLEVLKHISRELEDRAKNTFYFLSNYDIYGIELWEKLKPKILSEVEVLSDNLKLVGRIDRIEKYDDIIFIGEIKTGRFNGKPSFAHKIQLASYYLLAKENFPRYEVSDRAFVIYTSKGKREEIKIGKGLINYALNLRDKVINVIESEKDPGIINKPFCKKCPFYDFCYGKK